MSEARINELIFEGLFADDPELQSRPQLASSFTVAEDGGSMILNIRKDVRWHDGTPFTAEDVRFSIEVYTDKATASPERGRVSHGSTQYTSPDRIHYGSHSQTQSTHRKISSNSKSSPLIASRVRPLSEPVHFAINPSARVRIK